MTFFEPTGRGTAKVCAEALAENVATSPGQIKTLLIIRHDTLFEADVVAVARQALTDSLAETFDYPVGSPRLQKVIQSGPATCAISCVVDYHKPLPHSLPDSLHLKFWPFQALEVVF
jgi:hypothetical protein